MMSTFFQGITETVPILFRGIFSKQKIPFPIIRAANLIVEHTLKYGCTDAACRVVAVAVAIAVEPQMPLLLFYGIFHLC
jgi:hypothetical protein